MAGLTLGEFLRGGDHPHPSSGSEWADRAFRSAQRTPIPDIYPESPLVPRTFDYGSAVGRVIDPADVMRNALNPPTYASEHSVTDLPNRLNGPRPEVYPWWEWGMRMGRGQ